MPNAAPTVTDRAAPPLDGFQLSRLVEALEGLSPTQLTWASGYLAGIAAVPRRVPAPDAVPDPAPAMTVLYATQSGNARALAGELAAAADARGIAARLVAAEDYRPRDLAKERLLSIVISTQGEGEPPESSRELFRYLQGRKPARLDDLRFAVFGLGDSSYERFCQAGKDLDRLLQALGARPLLDRVDADVDFEAPWQAWTGDLLDRVADEGLGEAGPAATFDGARVIPLSRAHAPAPAPDRHHPYSAEVVDHRVLTTPDAVAEVHHLVLGIEPGALRFRPGDSLGVWAENDPALIAEVLELTGLDGDAHIVLRGAALPLRRALAADLELTQLHPGVVTAWAARGRHEDLRAIADDPARLRAYARSHQFADLLRTFPEPVDAETLAALLRPLQPRLYSIASSAAAFDDEVQLTLSTLRYTVDGRERLGAASGYLARRVTVGDPVRVYVADNPAFRLPASDDVPIIMVGAGTGIAPFRAFLQEREARGARGRNWLVFGNRHFHRDFLYQTEWLKFREAGLLERVSLAFSRDDARRVYVQDRLRELGAEIHRWLADGAQLYVCGGLEMDKAVRGTLQDIVAAHGGFDADRAADFIEDLREQGRYQRDVY